MHCHNVWYMPFHKTNGLTTEPNFFTSHMWRACMSTCGLVFRCLCLCVHRFETGNWGRKKNTFVNSVWGGHWPQTDHRVRGAPPQPAWWNRRGLSWPGIQQSPALQLKICEPRWIAWPMHIHTYTLIHACMRAHIHSSHLADIWPLAVCTQSNTAACAGKWMIKWMQSLHKCTGTFIPCIMCSHKDISRIEILQSPISASALPESVQ